MWGGTWLFSFWFILLSFQSTHPVWGGTMQSDGTGRLVLFQSTHPVWGGTITLDCTIRTVVISIHPPRVGWDCLTLMIHLLWSNFNPPTPCGVGRSHTIKSAINFLFQSTHPVWGGTSSILGSEAASADFNPPTPCGVGHSQKGNKSHYHNFNPPTPCGVGR